MGRYLTISPLWGKSFFLQPSCRNRCQQGSWAKAAYFTLDRNSCHWGSGITVFAAVPSFSLATLEYQQGSGRCRCVKSPRCCSDISTATAGPARNWDMWNPSIGAKDALFARQQFSVSLIACLWPPLHYILPEARLHHSWEARYDMVFLGCWRHGSQQSWNLGMLSCEHWSFTSTKCSDAIRMLCIWQQFLAHLQGSFGHVCPIAGQLWVDPWWAGTCWWFQIQMPANWWQGHVGNCWELPHQESCQGHKSGFSSTSW